MGKIQELLTVRNSIVAPLSSPPSHPPFVNAVCHNGIGHESQTTQTGKQLDNETNNQQKRQRN